MDNYVQNEATVKLGLAANPTTDYSLEFMSFIPKIARDEIVEEPTYGAPRRTTVLGAETDTVDVVFKSKHALTAFWSLAFQAIRSSTGLIYFSVKFATAATPISVDVPQWNGQLVVSKLDLSAAAAARWAQTQTYPAQNIVAQTA